MSHRVGILGYITHVLLDQEGRFLGLTPTDTPATQATITEAFHFLIVGMRLPGTRCRVASHWQGDTGPLGLHRVIFLYPLNKEFVRRTAKRNNQSIKIQGKVFTYLQRVAVSVRIRHVTTPGSAAACALVKFGPTPSDSYARLNHVWS